MKKKIVFVTGSLSDGGAEKVMSILASGCAELGNRVTLVVMRNKKIVYPVSDKVRIIQFNNEGKFLTVKRIIKLHKIIKESNADAVIPFLNTISVYTILANIGLKKKLILSVRADPNISMKGASLKDKMGRFLMNNLKWNEKADWTVFQTPDAQAYYSKCIQEKSSIIPNPLDLSSLPKRYTGEREKRIVAAGRFAEEKNFTLLITAFSRFIKDCPDYSLYIYGEGKERSKYENIIKELNLQGKVFLPGFASNLPKEIYKAGIYVSTSNHEGISNSMLEALGMGIPTIVTDCPIGGARMFVHNDENGCLIPMNNEDELLKSLIKIAKDKQYANRISESASRVREEISSETICKKWLELI